MIYLDYNATTPLREEAKQIMFDLAGMPLNPSSIHGMGRKAKSAIERARMQVAELLGIKDHMREYNITFTSSGTEANNLILSNYIDGEIFISNIEHSSISKVAEFFDNITFINVTGDGLLDCNDLHDKLSQSTAKKKLVSVMFANNETGVIQPLQEASIIAREYGAELHSDCIQAPGKIAIDIAKLDLDFATISGHKFGGPVGVGALISKAEFFLKPLIFGGGQEKSIRSGTENVLAIAGMGKVAELACLEFEENAKKMKEVRDYFEIKLREQFPHLQIIAQNMPRLANTSLFFNKGKSAETIVISLDLKGIAVSSGAACSSGRVAASKVLKAMGYSDDEAASAIRVSIGPKTSKEEIDQLLFSLNEIY